VDLVGKNHNTVILKLISSAFALLFTEIFVPLTTEISVKSSAKADETSLKLSRYLKLTIVRSSNIALSFTDLAGTKFLIQSKKFETYEFKL
jgi:hypothetical protein